MTDRKSTRLNSSHLGISYAVFCLKKKKKHFRLRLAGYSPTSHAHGITPAGVGGLGGEGCPRVSAEDYFGGSLVIVFFFFFKEWGAPRDLPFSPPGRSSD